MSQAPSPTRPGILAVTSEVPWPLNTGGHIRTFQLLRALGSRFRIHLIAASGPDQQAAPSQLADAGIDCEVVPLPRRRAAREAARAMSSWRGGKPYVLYGRHRHAAVQARVRAACAAFRPAVFYMDHLDAANYAGACTAPFRVIDLHNVYSLIARRSADDRALLPRLYLRHESRLLAGEEARLGGAADLLFSVSDQERHYYQTANPGAPVVLVPNGVDCAAYASLPTGRPSGSLILYVGAMSWQPNAQAALHLAEHVYPRIRQAHPEARLRIVGPNPPAALLALRATGIEVTGRVESVVPHLREASLLAVPLDVGGGTRLKILEAMASGLPVVSTPVGAEGLELESGVHLTVAEGDRFTEAVLDVLQHRAAASARAEAARSLVRGIYDWTTIGAAAGEAIDRYAPQPAGRTGA